MLKIGLKTRDYCDNLIQEVYETCSKDYRFENSFDLNTYEDGLSWCLDVLVNGNTLQKSFLSSELPLKATFSFPTLRDLSNSITIAKVFKTLRGSLKNLMAFYNSVIDESVEQEIVAMIYDQYGHFTLPQWFLFCFRAKAGKFKTSFQNISVRGLTNEFLFEWLITFDKVINECAINLDYSAWEHERQKHLGNLKSINFSPTTIERLSKINEEIALRRVRENRIDDEVSKVLKRSYHTYVNDPHSIEINDGKQNQVLGKLTKVRKYTYNDLKYYLHYFFSAYTFDERTQSFNIIIEKVESLISSIEHEKVVKDKYREILIRYVIRHIDKVVSDMKNHLYSIIKESFLLNNLHLSELMEMLNVTYNGDSEILDEKALGKVISIFIRQKKSQKHKKYYNIMEKELSKESPNVVTRDLFIFAEMKVLISTCLGEAFIESIEGVRNGIISALES